MRPLSANKFNNNSFSQSITTLPTSFLEVSSVQPSPKLVNNNSSLATNFDFVDKKYFHQHIGENNLKKMATQEPKFKYPKVNKDETIVETIFDVKVEDPYRFLEDPDSEPTKKFVKEQNVITESFLNECPYRSRIKEILTANQDYKKIGCSFKRGNKYYFYINLGLQPQSVLYQQDSLNSEPRVFFDPNKLSEDGTVALTLTSFSPDGEYFAYGLSYSGSDWIEIKIKNVTTGEDFPETLKRAKFTSLEWTHDNKGFFYCQFPDHKGAAKGTEVDSHENHSIFYHQLNTSQSEDILKVNLPEHPKRLISCEVSDDGHYLFVFPLDGCHDRDWYYCDLREFGIKDKLTLKPVYDKMDAQFSYIANNDNIVYFRTNLDAKNHKVSKLDLKNPAKENWVDVIPNHPEDVLESAEVYTVNGKDYILITVLRKVVYYLELHELEGKLIKKFDLPPGTIGKYSGRRKDEEFFFQFTSFLTPGQTYHFDLKNLDSDAKMLRQSKPKNFQADDYKIEQTFYKSKDGTEVPMFLIHRKDLIKDGTNPCLLYGYGGFNFRVTSAFNVNRIGWLKNFKGILAVANIRGGGEFGQNWHDSGRLLNKQNGFDDFISAAEYLIENKYTKKDKLAIKGGSNGGLLVAAVSNQRPDLFGATLCHVGVLDMVRFASFTIGHAWISDYGDPKEKDHFMNLIKYSPYHNIPEKTDVYPATMLLTADHDDRVVPAHSLKFIARLQEKLGEKLPNTPLIIRVDTKGGHGGGRPLWKLIEEEADTYSFLYNTLKLEKYYND